MAYKKSDLIKEAVEAIEKYKPTTVLELVSYLSCTRETFYAKKLHESDTIKAAFQKSKQTLKASLRQKLFKSKSTAAHIALYKLLSPEEAHLLGVNNQTIRSTTTTDGEGKTTHQVKISMNDLQSDQIENPE